MFFVRFLMKIEKRKLIHIKYEINTTFYQILHDNCEKNQNFADFQKGQDFQDHFWPEKAKKQIKYSNPKLRRKKTNNKLEMANQVNNKPNMPAAQKTCKLYPLIF